MMLLLLKGKKQDCCCRQAIQVRSLQVLHATHPIGEIWVWCVGGATIDHRSQRNSRPSLRYLFQFAFALFAVRPAGPQFCLLKMKIYSWASKELVTKIQAAEADYADMSRVSRYILGPQRQLSGDPRSLRKGKWVTRKLKCISEAEFSPRKTEEKEGPSVGQGPQASRAGQSKWGFEHECDVDSQGWSAAAATAHSTHLEWKGESVLRNPRRV